MTIKIDPTGLLLLAVGLAWGAWGAPAVSSPAQGATGNSEQHTLATADTVSASATGR